MFRLPKEKPLLADPDLVVFVLSFRPPPPKQKRTVDRNMQANAAHSKPKAYLPIMAGLPLARNAFRPLTYAVLLHVSSWFETQDTLKTHVIRAQLRAWKNIALMVRNPLSKLPSLLHSASRPVKRPMAVKNNAMSMKANMKRVM